GPGGGIFGGELVRDRIVCTAREAFHQMQLLAGSSEGASSSEIGRVNHQRIAVPMANRVSLPLADSLRDMRAPVGGDDARGVIDLVKKSHVSRPLHNLEKVTLRSEAFHQMQLLAGSSEGASSSEIGRVNHQRIAVPMANRVSLPLADSLRDMRAPVGGDDARGVIDLVKKSHVSRPLHNLEKVTL